MVALPLYYFIFLTIYFPIECYGINSFESFNFSSSMGSIFSNSCRVSIFPDLRASKRLSTKGSYIWNLMVRGSFKVVKNLENRLQRNNFRHFPFFQFQLNVFFLGSIWVLRHHTILKFFLEMEGAYLLRSHRLIGNLECLHHSVSFLIGGGVSFQWVERYYTTLNFYLLLLQKERNFQRNSINSEFKTTSRPKKTAVRE